MSSPWIESAFTITDAFREKILEMALKYPQAFMIRPKSFKDPAVDKNTWAMYDFTRTVKLWVDTSHPEAIEFYREHFAEEKEKTMTKALTIKENDLMATLLKANITAVGSVLPDHIPSKKMMRLSLQAVVLNPELARCSQRSFMNAVIEASSLGLEVGGATAQAHLVPYKGEVKLIPDYKGLIELGYRSPVVSSISAHPVYANDKFDYWYGARHDVRHTPFKGGDRGELVAAYAVVSYVSGGFDFEVVEKEDAMAAKEHSQAKNSKYSPWNKKADEWNMWVKTAVRRLMKRVPKNPDLQQAIVYDQPLSEKQNIPDVIDANFKNITDMPKTKEPPKDEPKDEPKQENPDHSPEDLKNIGNYNATLRNFPEQMKKAVEELHLQRTVLTPDLMKKVTKQTSDILDRENAVV